MTNEMKKQQQQSPTYSNLRRRALMSTDSEVSFLSLLGHIAEEGEEEGAKEYQLRAFFPLVRLSVIHSVGRSSAFSPPSLFFFFLSSVTNIPNA